MEINENIAKKLYKESSDWFKEQLVEEFGIETFEEKPFEKIKTFDDACIICGTTEKQFNDRIAKQSLDTDTISYEKLKIIVKAINTVNGETWVPDWNNSNEKKWWPWFVLSSGFGFSDSFYYYAHSATYVGSRLCFKSQDRSDYAATQFIDIYDNFLTIK